MGVTLNILYVWTAIGARRPFLAGLFLALSTATRTPIAFGVVLFLLEAWRVRDQERRHLTSMLVKFFAPLVVTAVILMVYNYLRFDNPLEFGHRYLQAGARPSIREHGLFSMWFLNRNLAAALVNLPVIDGVKPFIHITRNGLSFLFLTPVFILLLWPRFTDNAAPKTIYRNLLLASLAIFIPHVLYQNTGWAQFGFRFSLDFTPYLITALALSRRDFNRRFLVLVGIAIVLNLFGAITFGRINSFYYD
jgi:hypothetical protein